MSEAEIGSSLASVLASACALRASVATAALVRLSMMKASVPAPPPSARNGSIGMPGNSAITIMTAADMPSAFG